MDFSGVNPIGDVSYPVEEQKVKKEEEEQYPIKKEITRKRRFDSVSQPMILGSISKAEPLLLEKLKQFKQKKLFWFRKGIDWNTLVRAMCTAEIATRIQDCRNSIEKLFDLKKDEKYAEQDYLVQVNDFMYFLQMLMRGADNVRGCLQDMNKEIGLRDILTELDSDSNSTNSLKEYFDSLYTSLVKHVENIEPRQVKQKIV